MTASAIDIIGILATFSPDIRLDVRLRFALFSVRLVRNLSKPYPALEKHPRLLFAPTRWKSTIVPSRHGGSSNMAFMLLVAGTALALFAAALFIIERENAAT